MHRGDYIAPCYVPDPKTMAERKLVRHRVGPVRKRSACKNSIHGILLKSNFQTKAVPFSTAWIHQVRALKDYRIGDMFEQIELLDVQVGTADRRIARQYGVTRTPG